MARCIGRNKKGNQCGNDALPGLDYCKAHRNQGKGKNNRPQEVITHRHTDSVEPKQKTWFRVISTIWKVVVGVAVLGGLSVYINLPFDFGPSLVVKISTERSNFFDDTITFRNEGKIWLYNVKYKQQIIGLRFREGRTVIPDPNTKEEFFLEDKIFSLAGDIHPKGSAEAKLLLPFSVPVTESYLSDVEAYAICTVTSYRYRYWFFFKSSKIQRDGFYIDKIHGVKNWIQTSCEELFKQRRQLFPLH